MNFIDWLKKISGCQEDIWKNKYNELVKNLQPTPIVVVPEWLDQSQYPYLPYLSLEEGKVKLDDPKEIYASNILLYNIASQWKDLSLNAKLLAIWKFVGDALQYRYDVSEDWQFPITTYYSKFGDCEDGTILFVELCRLAGISADSVFNVCGWFYKTTTEKFGHSYPIAKMEDGQWYIFETTVHPAPTVPKLFRGSNYTGEWGLANWFMYGRIKGGIQI